MSQKMKSYEEYVPNSWPRVALRDTFPVEFQATGYPLALGECITLPSRSFWRLSESERGAGHPYSIL